MQIGFKFNLRSLHCTGISAPQYGSVAAASVDCFSPFHKVVFLGANGIF